jgi:hypothetical protein
MATKKEKLEKNIRDIQGQIKELAPKLALMQRTPRYDASYSEAKAHNWQIDLDQLKDKEAKALEQYYQYLDSDDYRKAAREQLDRLTAVMTGLNEDAAALKARLFEIRNISVAKIVAGDDPLVLAGEIMVIREEMEAIGEAAGLTKLALKAIKRPPQIDKPLELSKGEASRYKDYVPEHF